jgi:outer membrane lipoprotein-sorting protein
MKQLIIKSFCGCFTGPGKFAKRRAQGAKRKHDLRCAQNAMRHAPSPWPPEAKNNGGKTMKRVMMFSFIGFLFLSLISVGSFAQTVDEILEKMIEAQGGRKALEAIKTSTLSGSMMIIQMNITGSITMYQKEPNKMRMDIEMMGMNITQAFDGTTAWFINPQTGATEEMPEKQVKYFKRQALGRDVLLNPKKLGITYKFKGKEKINDKEYLVLEQIHPDDYTVTIYVDPQTYLLYKSKSMALNQVEVEVESESITSDYKKVEGIMMPHLITIFQGGQEYMKFTVNEITFNSDLEDAFFKMN